MNLITCAVATVPCPVDQQGVLSFTDVADLAAIGITPEAVLVAYAFGAGSVLTWWFVGYLVSLAIKLISKA